jgi:type IV secretion system protein VirB5
MAVALSVGALLLGVAADRLHRRGIGPQTLLAFVAMLFIAAQLALIIRIPLPSYLLWAVVAVVGATTVLSYAIVAEYFPKEFAGRANGALNVLHIGGAFVLQYAIGFVIQQWSGQGGHYPAQAYQTAFALNLALQAAALVWFVLPHLRVLGSDLIADLIHGTSLCRTNPSEPVTSYQQAAHVWAERLGSARIQAKNWRRAALGSTTLAALLGLALATTASRSSVVPYVVEVDRFAEAQAVDPASKPYRPSDAEITYFLARLVKNVRSLSTDPVVVRKNWLDAYDYLTAHAAQTLTDYARDANPYAKIGLRPITVDVIYIVRASSDSFEIHWKEQTYENGAVIRTERFTGIATIIFRSPKATETMRNPLGLYVHALNWSPDLRREPLK